MGRKTTAATKAVLPDFEAVFDSAQRSTANHSKGVAALQGQRQELGPEDFHAQLLAMVNFLLPVFRREPAVERCVDFVVPLPSFFPSLACFCPCPPPAPDSNAIARQPLLARMTSPPLRHYLAFMLL